MDSTRFRSQHAVVMTLVLMLGALPRVAMATSFTVTQIDVPGANETDVVGINNAGQLVGFFFNGTGQHGFVDTGGVFTTFNFPASTGTAGHGINSAGQIVGSYATTTCGPVPPTGCSGTRGFLDVGGVFTSINFPGAVSTEASGINSLGQIVGAFNTTGAVGKGVGDQGFLDVAGTFTPINAPGSIGTEAVGINNAGQIVGAYADASGAANGFLDVGGVFTTIDVPGALFTVLGGINNLGQIDGAFIDASNVPHAFFYAGGVFTTLILPGEFSTLGGINDAGQIDGSFIDASGTVHGFLATPTDATPVPEPAALLLLATGLSVSVVAARRRLGGRQ